MPGSTPILGNARAVERLWSALARDQLHHALLFEGPPHVGKRTTAMALAMAANCEGDGEPPCGSCASCKLVRSGGHPDVMIIEPAEDRATPIISVEQVREIVRKVGYHRYSGKRRVVIVDPAEAMGPSAANALLKTLEEPPEGTGFILVATQSSTLLPTILSRCQRVRFSAVPGDEIAAWLAEQGIADAHGVARLADGAPGRALALAGDGLATRRAIRDELIAVLDAPVQDVFKYTTKLTSGGRQDWMPRLDALIEVLQDLLRDTVVLGSGSRLPLIHGDRKDMLERWAQKLYPTGVARIEASLRELADGAEVNVMGKTLADQLLLRVQAELGKVPV
ncbi:MAG: DNA polymerase III subunit delta' [Deltaproteobacteria bacterium]|nr:MAG: DNA polymerase III subunit delta' [Deltaproteobacteria bacterium]